MTEQEFEYLYAVHKRNDTTSFSDELKQYDEAVFEACNNELLRQKGNIELIASENIVSKGVLLAMGTVLTNKYSEGYPFILF